MKYEERVGRDPKYCRTIFLKVLFPFGKVNLDAMIQK